jgi:hypothetical protein
LNVTTFAGDHDTRENLGAFFVAFANFGGDAYAVTDFERVVTAVSFKLRLGREVEEGMVAHG